MEPVKVEMLGRAPHRVFWRGSVFNIEKLVDVWVSHRTWWGNEERRVYMRLLTDRGTIDIYRSGEFWMLSRMVD
jgi:hypothetical protein